MKFYDREHEIASLLRIGKDFRIAVIGRRRVGKTTLVEHFYKERCVTFFIPAEKAEKEIIGDWAREYPDLHLPNVSSFREFFEFVFFHFKDRVIFLDEIQNLLKVNKSFLFDLQRLVDKHKPMLVVTGSLISTTKKVVENYKSPLYGRFDFIIKLRELSFRTVYAMCRDLNLGIEDAFLLYSVFGGIPKYYELVEKLRDFSFEDAVLEFFIRYPRPLYEEVRTILKEEFGKEYKTFFSVLSAISRGMNKQSEIADFIGKKQTEITKYLAMLREDFELIERKLPAAGGKKGIYSIKNNIFLFWFDNVWRYSQLLETGEESKAAGMVRSNLKKHISLAFERTIHELIQSKDIPLPFAFTKLGRQWGKIKDMPKGENTYEIDIVALNEEGMEIMFGECKWQDRVDPGKILEELKEKGRFVDWNLGKRKEFYAIFAKSFSRRDVPEGVMLFDLKDMEKVFTQQRTSLTAGK